MTAVVLDAGALIGIERNDRRIAPLVSRWRQRGADLVVPAGVLAQVWRSPRRQVRLVALVRDACIVEPLDGSAARLVGGLLAASRTTDVVDAHVVLVARTRDAPVVTSEPDDLLRIDPRLRIVAL